MLKVLSICVLLAVCVAADQGKLTDSVRNELMEQTTTVPCPCKQKLPGSCPSTCNKPAGTSRKQLGDDTTWTSFAICTSNMSYSTSLPNCDGSLDPKSTKVSCATTSSSGCSMGTCTTCTTSIATGCVRQCTSTPDSNYTPPVVEKTKSSSSSSSSSQSGSAGSIFNDGCPCNAPLTSKCPSNCGNTGTTFTISGHRVCSNSNVVFGGSNPSCTAESGHSSFSGLTDNLNTNCGTTRRQSCTNGHCVTCVTSAFTNCKEVCNSGNLLKSSFYLMAFCSIIVSFFSR